MFLKLLGDWIKMERAAFLLACLAARASGDSQPVLHVANRCPQKASLTYPRVNTYSPFPTTRLEVEPMSTVTAGFCYDGRPLKVRLGESDDGKEAACETWSNPFDCAAEGSLVVIECEYDDGKSPSQCGAREIHEHCVGWGDMDSFCPARSTELKETHFDVGKYRCGGKGVFPSSYSAGLDAVTHCPLCRCNHPSECVGDDCGDCGGVVSRSADVACVPESWAKLSPADVPVATLAPARSPHSSPSSHHSSTAAPSMLPSGATSTASSTAAILIALVAGGITACAIRQAVVKRRKREAVGGAQFVDIPNRPVSFTATQVHNPLAGAMAGRGGYDEIPSAGAKPNSAVDAYGNTDL